MTLNYLGSIWYPSELSDVPFPKTNFLVRTCFDISYRKALNIHLWRYSLWTLQPFLCVCLISGSYPLWSTFLNTFYKTVLYMYTHVLMPIQYTYSYIVFSINSKFPRILSLILMWNLSVVVCLPMSTICMGFSFTFIYFVFWSLRNQT